MNQKRGIHAFALSFQKKPMKTDQTNYRPSKRVLVVDDEPEIQEILIEHLNTLGIFTVNANSGNEAIRICQNNSFDGIITDLKMNDGDGIVLAQFIQKTPYPRPKLFICSGNILSPSEVRSLQINYSIEEYFQKPFDFELLSKMVLNKL